MVKKNDTATAPETVSQDSADGAHDDAYNKAQAENQTDTVDEDVNEDNTRLVAAEDILTVKTVGCKPVPQRDGEGKIVTVMDNGKPRIVFPDQDLYAIGGRATGYCFVQTSMGTSLQLVGEFEASTIVPDHNGEVGKAVRGAGCILPGKGEKVIISQIEALGLPIGMTGEIVTNGETNISRTGIHSFENPLLFAAIISAQPANTVTGYQYVVRFVEKTKREAAQSSLMLGSALKKLKILQLAAPDSKHAK